MISDLFHGFTEPNKPLYINNHLTPYFATLLQASKKAITDKKIFACWISNGGVMIKTTEQSFPILIESFKEPMAHIDKEDVTMKTKSVSVRLAKRKTPDETSPGPSNATNGTHQAKSRTKKN